MRMSWVRDWDSELFSFLRSSKKTNALALSSAMQFEISQKIKAQIGERIVLITLNYISTLPNTKKHEAFLEITKKLNRLKMTIIYLEEPESIILCA